jgi:hypothetical protein
MLFEEAIQGDASMDFSLLYYIQVVGFSKTIAPKWYLTQ